MKPSLFIKYLFFLLVNIMLISCSSKKSENEKQGPPPPQIVDVIIASNQNIENKVEVNGLVLANETVDIHPEVSGRLIMLNMPDGATVNEGTILAKINDADLQAQLLKSKSQLSLAEKNEERLNKLLQINGINQADYDVALNTVNNIKADIELLKAQIDKTIIRAPFTGILGLRMVSPGAYVTPQLVMGTLQQTNQLKIDFSVPEMYGSLIKKGNSIKVIADNNQEVTATIEAEESQVNASTGNIKIRAILKQGNLKPGSFVKIQLDAGDGKQSIMVPTNAIIPDANSKKIIVVKEGKGEMVKIKTGLRKAYGVEVIDGLNPGDSIVVTGVLFVKSGKPVKVRSVKNLQDLINK
jgi:membrane fusion protein (multidrug efflux system)